MTLFTALFLTPWKLAFYAILPMMGFGSKLRVWAALMLGSIAAYVAQTVEAYILIDLLTAAVVLSRPAGEWQKAIGSISVFSGIVGLFFWISVKFFAGQGEPERLAMMLNQIGWVQFAILGAWGGNDILRRYLRRSHPLRHSHAPDERGFS